MAGLGRLSAGYEPFGTLMLSLPQQTQTEVTFLYSLGGGLIISLVSSVVVTVDVATRKLRVLQRYVGQNPRRHEEVVDPTVPVILRSEG